MIARLVERLEREVYAIDTTEPIDVAYRRGWNACQRHVLSWLRIEAGLVELERADRDGPR